MRLIVKIRFWLALAAMIALTQCGVNLGMFPDFLTSVSQHRNVGDVLQHSTGEKFFFYAIHAAGPNTDFVYIIQILPDGNRRLLVLNGVLGTVITADNQPVGGMHAELDIYNHLSGICILNFPGGNSSPTVSPAPTFASLSAYQDYTMTKSNTSIIMFYPPTYAAGQAQIDWQTFTFSSTLTNGSAGTLIFTGVNRNLSLEAAGNQNMSTVYLVLRDVMTDEGFIYSYSGDNPGSSISSTPPPMGRIVPGTAQVTPDGEIVAQTYDGKLERFNSNGTHDNDTPATDFLGYLIAYGSSQAMYMFNPSTFEVLKTRSWWNNSNY